MFGPDLFAGLALAASILAPALPPRTDWVGEPVFIKKSGTTYGNVEPDGNFTPVGRLRSIQYVVVKDEKGKLQLNQDGKSVWVAKDDMVRLKDAVDHYTKMLDADPNNDVWFAFRGWARLKSGKPEEALKDYGEAIRLKPEAPHWFSNRGLIHLELKKVDEAITDFTASIDLAPDNDLAYRNRALAYTRKKDFAAAATDYAKAAELNPESAVAQNGLAWLLCTAPDDKVRDGKRVVEAAKKACELTDHKNGGYLDTLAAAYAELGEFDKAVEWQEKALKAGDIPIKDLDAARKRLELFRKNMPYRGDE
jgi:tetratricopeptide (TPR) repeat protein